MTDDNVHRLPRLGLRDAMRLFGMTARAIRFYEERGLVEARRDRLNRRFYDGPARVKLGWISRLRGAGVSLPDVQRVLIAEDENGTGRECAVETLRLRRAALETDLQRIDAAIAALETRAAPGRSAISTRL